MVASLFRFTPSTRLVTQEIPDEATELVRTSCDARAPQGETFQHARPHGEEARHSRRSLRTLGCDARRLEPWQQVRTRGHPSRRPRFARAPQDKVGGVERFTACQDDEDSPACVASAPRDSTLSQNTLDCPRALPPAALPAGRFGGKVAQTLKGGRLWTSCLWVRALPL